MSPVLSELFRTREPSAIRVAGLRFAERGDDTKAVNVAIGNVSLPMHPAMIERLENLRAPGSPFENGVVAYTATGGTPEANRAFLHVLASSGFDPEGIHCQITQGGSEAMELIVAGVCGPPASGERPLLLIDAAYTNYTAFAERLGRATVSITRELGEDGQFTLPDLEDIERVIVREKPGALVVIPYDNPTGQFFPQESLVELARLCVKHDLWIVSDEAYRELYYVEGEACSIWAIGEDEVPGIRGRRIGIDSSSKVWNACGLRIGGLLTDSAEFHRRATAEHTASLCPSAIGQWIFAALNDVPAAELRAWYARQRDYYRSMLHDFTSRTRELLPDAIVSSPDAALYSVVDVRRMAPDFDALEFVLWCASEASVAIAGEPHTLLVAPMAGFYDLPADENPGRTQMRIAYVVPPADMAKVPDLLAALLEQWLERTAGVGRGAASRGTSGRARRA
ncbi:MAG: aminotransferase class I/II-fold pyridoxal phosphate-dependent enzyme [Gemmatimonadetes bacterium]|nr:aminotransferase class I/II-fold pyridoxal phosphate-dependent enzyme [Gemmatimonadota bacterium]